MNYRSRHQRCSVRKGVLKNFAKPTGRNPQENTCAFFTKHLRVTASGTNIVSIHGYSLFISDIFVVLQKILSLSAFSNDK